MAETQTSKSERKRERQPISVPFVWEEKPGIPKKDWKPTPHPIKPVPPPPKFIVSVPFGWEEKPGTPLTSFAQHPKQSVFFSSPPTTYSDHDYEEEDGSSDSDERAIETWNYETDDDSFTSAKSLLANALIPTNALASAVPVEVKSPGSPASEAESCTSSYASGTTSLVGASFLEWLFPLLVQNSSSQENVEKDPSCEVDVGTTEFLHERNGSQVKRKPLLTLGELIVMSRRRSCQRKVVRMHKQPSMDSMKENAFGCCIAGIGNGISGFHVKWKRQLQLKLM